MVAMSGGVDSSVAAFLVKQSGREVVGVTLKLWGGDSDSGCCSVDDVEDARRVCHLLGIRHTVFNFADHFQSMVVDQYVEDHRLGLTPNPCIECNRHIKFDILLQTARRLGFDSVVTGHHARVVKQGARWRLLRSADASKDQSYVLSMLGQDQLGLIELPLGTMTKREVRKIATLAGFGVAEKPDSQEVCFIQRGGREEFLTQRLDLTPGRLVDEQGAVVGSVDALELLTPGQRRGLKVAAEAPHYVYDVDLDERVARIGPRALGLVDQLEANCATTTGGDFTREVIVQPRAHGGNFPALVSVSSALAVVRPIVAVPRVASGQTLAFYEGDEVLGSARVTGCTRVG